MKKLLPNAAPAAAAPAAAAPAAAAPAALPQSGGAFVIENGALKPDETTLSTQVTAPLGRASEADED